MTGASAHLGVPSAPPVAAGPPIPLDDLAVVVLFVIAGIVRLVQVLTGADKKKKQKAEEEARRRAEEAARRAPGGGAPPPDRSDRADEDEDARADDDGEVAAPAPPPRRAPEPPPAPRPPAPRPAPAPASVEGPTQTLVTVDGGIRRLPAHPADRPSATPAATGAGAAAAARALLLGTPASRRDRLRSAVLWAEVLGPPRAHRRRRR